MSPKISDFYEHESMKIETFFLRQEEIEKPISDFLLPSSDMPFQDQDSSREIAYQTSDSLQSWREMYLDSFTSQDGFNRDKLSQFTSQDLPHNCHVSGATTDQEMQFPETVELKNQFSTPLEILHNYASNTRKSRDEAFSKRPAKEADQDRKKLSTEDILRLAGERYIQFSSQRFGNSSTMFHPYGGSAMNLSSDEIKDVELVWFLLSAAEKVGYQQYDSAIRLLNRCDWIASDTGNPIQRIVFYYTKALKIKIGKETGKNYSEKIEEEEVVTQGKSLVLGSCFSFVVVHQGVPFQAVMQFSGMQAILENIAAATRIHLIDLQIRNGMHWTILMQALAVREEHPIKTLKLTAIGTKDKQEMEVEGTCQRLVKFAESLSLPFAYEIVLLSDIKDFKAEIVKFEAEESLVVYSPTFLRSMISKPQVLDSLMVEIKRLKPTIMAVNEVEANLNSPSFFKRFIESLFYHGVYFDCFEDCLRCTHEYRMRMEGVYFWDGIRDIVSNEGEERLCRSVKIDVWREFFARFGMVEVELSESAFYQAKLVRNQFACGGSCVLQKNGKCLIAGWKGTPLHSLSLWTF